MKENKRTCGKVLLVLILLMAAAWLAFTAVSSSLEYRMMSTKEQLKAHLQQEYQVYSSSLFQSLDIQRPWYSLSPEAWTYHVTLSEGRGSHTYVWDGAFREIP